MNRVVLSIPEKAADVWLDTISEEEGVDDLEVTPAGLDDQNYFVRLVRKAGLNIRSVREVIPPEVGRNLERLKIEERARMIETLRDRIVAYSEEGVCNVALNLGMEGIEKKENDEALSGRVAMVKKLITVAESRNVRTLIPVRYPPPYPSSCTWEFAANLVHDVMHPACSLLVEFHPGEIEAAFDTPGFIKRCAFHLGGIRFVYEPMLGESPSIAEIKIWSQYLEKYGFRGDMTFAPKVAGDDDAVASACSRVAGYARALNEGPPEV
ncbi:MAG: hypothetical protein R6V56_08675 [Lentisphaeria bacterium]